MDCWSSSATLRAHTPLTRASVFSGRDVRVNKYTILNHFPKGLNVEKNCITKRFQPCLAMSALSSDDLLATDLPMKETAGVLEERIADPKKVVSVVLGGGAGAELFPLTTRTATPAVPIGGCYKLIDIPMSNSINSGIKKIYILTQFNSASLNRHIHRTYSSCALNFADGFVEVLAATQTPGESGMEWFQGTADAIRQFVWLLEDVRNKDVENVVVLSGDQLYRMDYMDFVQHHIDTKADITISCVPVDESHASQCGLLKIDEMGRVIEFNEKPKGCELKSMCVNKMTSLQSVFKSILSHPWLGSLGEKPYIASMGVYVFKKETLLDLLKLRFPSANDFGSEIIPAAVKELNVQAFFFNDYWEDIGTLKAFYEANLALTKEKPNFEFYDPKTPFYTSPRFLPPTKMDKCKIKDAIISHGCFLRECVIKHSIVGERSRLDFGVELKDTLMMGADDYQTESEIANLLAAEKVPIGIGRNTKIRKCIIDKNARIGRDVIIMNKDGVQEADRPNEGFYIRSGIVIIMEKATIPDGTII